MTTSKDDSIDDDVQIADNLFAKRTLRKLDATNNGVAELLPSVGQLTALTELLVRFKQSTSLC